MTSVLRLTALVVSAAAVLPAVAASEAGPTIEAVNKKGSGAYAEERHAWSPQQVSVAAGGAARISNPSEVPHGVRWVSTPSAPVCSGVPGAGPGASFAAKWSGSCTFTQPGTYTFYCTVHGAEMTGTVFVSAAGAAVPPGTSSPLAGTPAQAIKLPSRQRGKAVRGSVAISPAGAGAKLEVDLLAKSASLAGPRASVLAGRLVRFGLRAGTTSFSVPLKSRARSALGRHRRLTLSVRVLVTFASAPSVAVTRSVLLRP